MAEIEGTASAEGFVVPCRYTHEQLGAMVGAKRVAVTRSMKKLRVTGALEADNERILIKEREALEGIATGFAVAR